MTLRPSLLRRALIGIFLIVLPIQVLGASVADVLTVGDNAAVSRGAFVRAATLALEVPMPDDRKELPYKRPVPSALRLSVKAAYGLGALEIFGDDLKLSRSITRGEALFVVMKLQALKPSRIAVGFPDVPRGSPLEQAVQVATEKAWMDPLRANFFGVTRVLSGREARLLLRKVIGEGEYVPDTLDGEKKIPNVVIRLKTKEIPPLPQEDLLRAVWKLLTDQYLRKDKLSEEEAAYRAAEALVNSVNDPYTTFMRPLSTKEFQSRLEGEVSGIGAQVEFKDGVLIIVAPINGSPAERAGLKPGDQILAVDGVSLAGMDFLQSVSKVRGPTGSTARLHIKRDGIEMDVPVQRAVIKVPEITVSKQGNIAVVKLQQFGDRTRQDLRTLLADVQTQHPTGIILDLRNNPGGLLSAADLTVSNFLPQGSVVASIIDRDQTYTEATEDPPTIDPSVKVIVLVNKGSASASEIVAGALQDAKRATVLGEQTFGKGTVQEIVEFRSGASMKMTIAEWRTPSGRKIDGLGLKPDIEVSDEAGRDAQMLRALDLLR